jgi:CRP/FNR family transcriptional regulator, cyclic AMP receptor protein
MPLPAREFLQALTTDERADLVRCGTTQRVDEGQILMERGGEADRVIVVVAGTVRVTRDDVELARRGPGALLGEMAIVDHRPRSATVEALEPCEIVSVPANQFRSFLGRSPHAALAVIEQLGRRLREADRR